MSESRLQLIAEDPELDGQQVVLLENGDPALVRFPDVPMAFYWPAAQLRIVLDNDVELA